MINMRDDSVKNASHKTFFLYYYVANMLHPPEGHLILDSNTLLAFVTRYDPWAQVPTEVESEVI